jgi:hypothetical protein
MDRPMTEDTTDPVAPEPGTPEAIRDEMAQTRAALSRKLGALQDLLLGTPHPARTGEPEAMAKKTKAGGAAKKPSKPSAAKTKVKKSSAAKASAARTLPKAKAGTKKSAAGRTLAKKSAAKTTAKKVTAKKAPAKKKSVRSKVVTKVKEVLGDLAAGAAAGAVSGAAAAAAPHIGQAASSVEQTAEQPPAIGGPTPTM